MGIVVGDANKQRREALEQVDDVIRKWQSTQDTCDDYKGKLEQAEFTNAAHVKVCCNLTHIVAAILVQHVPHCNVVCCSVMLQARAGK